MDGMAVIIRQLFGGDTGAEFYEAAIGKTITVLSFTEERLRLEFEDHSWIEISDAGQSCCESRYMTTDDTLEEYAGSLFLGARLEDAPSRPTEYDDHDCQFTRVDTSAGTFTIETHVEHNGYYGGFAMIVRGGKEGE